MGDVEARAAGVLREALQNWALFPVREGFDGSQMPMTTDSLIEHVAAALAEAGLLADGAALVAAEDALARTKRGAETLGRIVERQCRDALDATGRHDLIAEDGDGDWGLVWELLAELRPRAERAEATLDRVRTALLEGGQTDRIRWRNALLALDGGSDV